MNDTKKSILILAITFVFQCFLYAQQGPTYSPGPNVYTCRNGVIATIVPNLLRQTTTKGGTVQFNVMDLHNGVNYLHVYDGVNDKPEIQQVIINNII